MLRIRFHGRGGQGMKTASRLLGSAALGDGRSAQISPLYGVVGRGVPMVAWTRIADEPILERGGIAAPDIVVVADEILLEDAEARPLQGLTPGGVVLINSQSPPEALRHRYDLGGALAALDATALALSQTRSMAGLSVALGAAACKLVGLSPAAIEHAVRAELGVLGVDGDCIGRNIALAHVACARVTRLAPVEEHVELELAAAPHSQYAGIAPAYQSALPGTASIKRAMACVATGNRTGTLALLLDLRCELS